MKTSSAGTVSLPGQGGRGLYPPCREGERKAAGPQGSRSPFVFGGLIIGFGCGESGGSSVVKMRSSPSGAGTGVGGARLGAGNGRSLAPPLTMSRFVIGALH